MIWISGGKRIPDDNKPFSVRLLWFCLLSPRGYYRSARLQSKSTAKHLSFTWENDRVSSRLRMFFLSFFSVNPTKILILHPFYRALTKPGTWNIPEHPGTRQISQK